MNSNSFSRILESICTYFVKISKHIILILFSIFIASLSVVSLLSTTYYPFNYNEHPFYKSDNPMFLIFICTLVLIILFLFDKYYGIEKINTKTLLCILLIYTFIVATLWVIVTHSMPGADQEKVSFIANQFCDHDFSALEEGGYLFLYPFQLGIVAFLEIIYKIIGKDSYQIFQLLNVFAVCVIFYAIYKITNIFFKNNKINNIVLLLLFGCFPPIMYCTFVYGNLIGIMLSLVAVWMQLEYFNNNNIKFFIVSTISIALAIIIKNNSMIVLVAMVIIFLLYILEERKFTKLILPVCFVVVSLLSGTLLNIVYENRSGIKVDSGTPKIVWVAMGLQEGSIAPGWWNKYSMEAYSQNNYDYEQTRKQAQKDIDRSLSEFKNNPQYAAEFFYEKFVSQWNDPSYQGYWISAVHNHNGERSSTVMSLYYGELHSLSLQFMNGYHFIVVLGTLFFILLKRKSINTNQLFLALIIFGGFLFHMIWEAKGQYTMTYFIMLIPYTAAGIESICKFGNLKLKKDGLDKQ